MYNPLKHSEEDLQSKVQRLFQFNKLRLMKSDGTEKIKKAQEGGSGVADPLLGFCVTFISIMAIILLTIYMRNQQRIPHEILRPAPAA